MYFIDLCKGNPKLTENARCIKARYDGGVTNRTADNSGVLCISGECPDRTEETALIQLKRGKAEIREQDYTKCLIAGYDKIGVSNRGESSRRFLWLPRCPHSRQGKEKAERSPIQRVRRACILPEYAGQTRRISLCLRFLR